MSSGERYLCKARYLGRRPVDGPLNDYKLTGVVSALQLEQKSRKGKCGQHELLETRCHLEFSDRQLTVTYIKKDEGFESDTESAKSVEPPSVVVADDEDEDKPVSGVEEKIIKDHVFRYSESGKDTEKDIKRQTFGEDSYCSNSGGSGGASDSETSDHNKSSSSSSGTSSPAASASPTAELNKTTGYKFDHLDTFAISDVLICHTDRTSKACVVWVVRRSGGAPLEALVFDCLTEENARGLYRKFHEVSKRSKLERHRRRKSDGGSIITTRAVGGVNVSDMFSRPPPPLPSTADVIRARGGSGSVVVGGGEVSISHVDTTSSTTTGLVMTMTGMSNNNNNNNNSNNNNNTMSPPQSKWSLVQHTDRNGVTHIEVEATGSNGASSLLVKRNNNNGEGSGGGSSAAIDTSPRSLANFSSPAKFAAAPIASASTNSNGPGNHRWTGKTEKSKFAKELETILSTELRRRGGGGNSDEVSGISGGGSTLGPERIAAEVVVEQSAGKQGTGIGARSPAYGGRMMRSAPHGESLSLRQRTPAMLLRKLDEFEEKAHRIWAKAEAEEENRKVWSSSHVRGSGVNTAAGASSSSSSLIGISAPLPRGPQLDPPIKKPLLVVAQPGMNKEDPAPPTQQQQQQQQPTTPLVVKKTEESSNNRILIPTKTGREPPKKLYPKESPPLFSGGSAGGARFVPVVGVSGSQMGLLATSGGLHHHHHQPHSLPLYPVQLGWSRYPPAPGGGSGVGDVVAPMSQLDVWKYAAAVQESWRPAAVVVPSGSSGGGSSTIGISSGGERSRSRDRSRGGGNIVDPEHRRRAQSKSPARRPTISSRMEEVAGIGRMFRDFGDAVRSRMGGGGGSRGGSNDVRINVMLSDQAMMADGSAALKSNLKKQRGNHHPDSGGAGRRGGPAVSAMDTTDGPLSAASAMMAVTGGDKGGGGNSNGVGGVGQDNKKVHFNKFATVQMMG